MDRKSFTQKLALLGICPLIIQNLSGSVPETEPVIQDEKLQALQSQKQFIEMTNILLLDTNDPSK